MKNQLSLTRMTNLCRFKSWPILIIALLSITICSCAVSAMAGSDSNDFSFNSSTESLQRLVTYPGKKKISELPLKLYNDSDNDESVQAILYNFPDKLTGQWPFEAEYKLSGLSSADTSSTTVASFVFLLHSDKTIDKNAKAKDILQASSFILTATLWVSNDFGYPRAPQLKYLKFSVMAPDFSNSSSDTQSPFSRPDCNIDNCLNMDCDNVTVHVRYDGSSVFVDDGIAPFRNYTFRNVGDVDGGVVAAGLVVGDMGVEVLNWSFLHVDSSDATPTSPPGPEVSTSGSGLSKRQEVAIFCGVGACAVLAALALFLVCCYCGKSRRGGDGERYAADGGRSLPVYDVREPNPRDVERGSAPLNPSAFEVSGTASWIKPIQAR